MLDQLRSARLETPEEREKRERREARLSWLARLADGLGTFHTAVAHARGERPIELPKMSAKAQEKFEKAKAQRDKDRDRWLGYAIELGNIKDKDRDFSFRVTQAEQQQSRFERQQDRLDRQEEASRLAADARVKYYQALAAKNDEQAAYWKTRGELLERGYPLQQAEALARIEERKARAAKARAGSATGASGRGGQAHASRRLAGGRNGDDGMETVTRTTDSLGRQKTTVRYRQPHATAARQARKIPTGVKWK